MTVIELHQQDASLILPEPLATNFQRSQRTLIVLQMTRNSIRLQVTRTIPKGIYGFVPEDGIATILDSYKRAFARAKQFIYIENQYFWRRTFLGFENPGLGLPNADMEELMQLTC